LKWSTPKKKKRNLPAQNNTTSVVTLAKIILPFSQQCPYISCLLTYAEHGNTMKHVAIIDMGTNTFHLMLATVSHEGFTIHHREKVPVKIGVGGINHGYIAPEGTERAIHAMTDFKKTIDMAGIQTVLAFGTSALRNAHNGEEVAKKIEAASGIKTQIISGLQEAEYIYKGARAAIDMGNEKALIMDIGGGSVEFIIGNSHKIFWSHSFEIGGQRLLEKFHKHDPIASEEVKALFDFFGIELSLLFSELQIHKPHTLIGSSGTFDTLSDIYCIKNNIPLSESPETPFDISAFDDIYRAIVSKDRAARMQIPGMIEMRVDMIVVACCLIKFVLGNYPFQQVRVSSYSLKEGVLASL
jgi:exopolyphosphatase / guanosine-5'-triphosphate,3'-diphosphate pyrophosphatase